MLRIVEMEPSRAGSRWPAHPASDSKSLSMLRALALSTVLTIAFQSPAQAVGFTFVQIADTATPQPGGTGNFSTLGAPAISNGEVVFYGDRGGVHGDQGIYAARIGGVLRVVVDEHVRIPNDPNGTFFMRFANDPDIDHGRVAFVGLNAATPVPGGVYISTGSSLDVVADTRTPHPNSSGNFLATEFYEARNAGGVPAFMTWQPSFPDSVFKRVNGNLVVVADESTPIPSGSGTFVPPSGSIAFEWIASSDGHVAFIGRGPNSQVGIYSDIGDSLIRIADRNTPHPGGTGTLTGFSRVGIDGDRVVFSAGGTASTGGIFLYERGSLSVVATHNVPDPDGSGFLGTLDSPSIDDQDVVFSSHFPATSTTGAFARLNGRLTKVIEPGDSLASRIVRNVSLSSHAIEDRQVALQVSFTDGSAGVFVATATPECSDGIDNDGDGRSDYPSDPGCQSAASLFENPACNDGIDNDHDILIDYPTDPGCAAAWSDIENPACNDGIDDDGDGHTDYPADPGCWAASSTREDPACNDGVDNDSDGATDFPLDAGCVAAWDLAEAPPCDGLWTIRWFGCDMGNDNTFVLERDGTPVCGSSNCPGAADSCWGPPVTDAGYSSAAISWSTDSGGALGLTHDRDVQSYGETYLYAPIATAAQVPFSADVGRVWLNDTDITSSGPPGSVTLPLEAGPNHLEWTSYNQNAGTGFALGALGATTGVRMHSSLSDACEFDSLYDRDGDGVPVPIDCDDTNAQIHPGHAEVPGNGLDDDCNDATADCVDADSDGYSVSGGTCGAVDCIDTNAQVNPGQAEIPGNGLDDDCNPGTSDCKDVDSDGYGSPASAACTHPAADCNDSNANVNPGRTEIPSNGIDDDCNAATSGGCSAP